MTDERKVQLNTRSFRHTIESLRNTYPLPLIPSTDLDRLDLHNTGPNVVHEVLRSCPIAGLGYRELSRYLSCVTANRMRDLDVFGRLASAWEAFDAEIARHNQRVRVYYTRIVESVQRSYRPFVPRNHLHIWFWDEETKSSSLDQLSRAQLPTGLFFALAAEPLSELVGVSGPRKADLLEEHLIGKSFADYVLTTLEWATRACQKEAGAIVEELH